MTTRDVTIEIKQGTDASPVAKCVQVASQFESKIYVEYETKRVNAKSIMGMMASVRVSLTVTALSSVWLPSP